MTNRICSSCGIEKSETEFRKEPHKKQCKQCLNEKSKAYNSANKKARQEYSKLYQRGDKRKEYITEYYQLNKDKLRNIQKQYENEKYENDPIYRLRKIMSRTIYKALKDNNTSKNHESIKKILTYSIQELKTHLEKQFEPWMNWNNQGIYHSNIWNDNDQSTWTWQIDHIIPQSLLPYTSMKDENFQKCWALDNLRPYSAKQNIIDGANRIRHIGRTTE